MLLRTWPAPVLLLLLLQPLLALDPAFAAAAIMATDSAPTSGPRALPPVAATLREEDATVEGAGGVRLAVKVCNRRSPIAVVLAHPYGPLGGSMFVNLISRLTQCLAREGVTTVRFNARGVPPSTGRASWRGLKEKADLAAVCRFALTQLEEPPGRLVLIGYSHGGILTSAVAGEMPEVLAYAAIAYPFSVAWALTFFHQGAFLAAASQGNKPKLFLMGTADNFTGLATFRSRVQALPSPLAIIEVEGADHFFGGKEGTVVKAVLAWLQDIKPLLTQPPSTEVVRVADTHQELEL